MSESVVEINVRTLEGDGAFKCQNCNRLIDPDDESGENYKFVDTKLTKEGDLESLTLKCACGQLIKLKGFLPLEAA